MTGFSLPQPRYSGFLILAALLLSIQMTLIFRSGDLEGVNLTLIIWVAVASQLSDRPQPIVLDSDRLSKLIGTLLLAAVLLKVPQLSGTGLFLSLLPFLCALGFALLSVGRSQLGHYWKELAMVAVLAIPGEKALSQIFEAITMGVAGENLATLTAKFTMMVLNTIGIPTSLQEVTLILPNTTVLVDEGCSGARGMDFLLRLALVALLMFASQKLQRVVIPLSAIAIAFGVNGIRATLMSILANQGDMESFDYWHLGDGSQIFGMAAVLLFVGVCYLTLRRQRPGQPLTGGHP